MTDHGAAPRALSRNETHDLGMIVKDRAKVLRSHVDGRAAVCIADFEQKLAAVYSFDNDEHWAAAAQEAAAVVKEANKKIADRCKALGIPPQFAPGLALSWHGRGENAISQRRTELRRVAKTRVDAMAKAAYTKIEHQSLDLRTQIVAMGVLSAEARLFLESLAPIDETMRALEFNEVELALEHEKQQQRKDGYR